MRTWSNDILAAAPKMNYMSSQSLFSTTQRDPGKETYSIQKSRADVAGKLTDDDKCSTVSVSVSSLQVAVIIHNNYCITDLHHEDFTIWHKEASFF